MGLLNAILEKQSKLSPEDEALYASILEAMGKISGGKEGLSAFVYRGKTDAGRLGEFLSSRGAAVPLDSGDTLVLFSRESDYELFAFHIMKVFSLDIRTSFFPENGMETLETVRAL